MIKVQLERTEGDYGFEAKDEKGHTLLTDSSASNGGLENGFRPMQLLLAALGSCSAIDIVSILKKQRQDIEKFTIDVQGEREKEVIPALWKTIDVSFHLTGNIDLGKAEKATSLSIEKYCSVAETLRRAGATITWKTIVTKPD